MRVQGGKQQVACIGAAAGWLSSHPLSSSSSPSSRPQGGGGGGAAAGGGQEHAHHRAAAARHRGARHRVREAACLHRLAGCHCTASDLPDVVMLITLLHQPSPTQRCRRRRQPGGRAAARQTQAPLRLLHRLPPARRGGARADDVWGGRQALQRRQPAGQPAVRRPMRAASPTTLTCLAYRLTHTDDSQHTYDCFR